jgi:hypothetical protein
MILGIERDKCIVIEVIKNSFMLIVEGELKKLESNNLVLTEFMDFFDFDTQVPDPHKAKWGKYPE